MRRDRTSLDSTILGEARVTELSANGAGGPRQALHQSFEALVEGLHTAEQRLTAADPPLTDEDLTDGYRWLFSVLQVGLDTQVWADTGRPRMVEIVGPDKKWGGDNSDAFYQFAPIDPDRTYRVRGRRGDAVYLSFTVYGGPRDGHYSDRIVATINDRQLDIAEDGTFEFVLSQEPHDGNWLAVAPDAVCAISRDYLIDPEQGRRAEWSITADDPPERPDDGLAVLARRFGYVRTWFDEQTQMAPLRIGPANEVGEPYPVSSVTMGWAAGDAAYAMGGWELGAGEALVIEGRSPPCVFWNLCLWNPFLHTYDYRYEQVTINGGQVTYEPDGSWRIVVAATDPGVPNWISTAGRSSGLLWFRWFLPESTPLQPQTRVVPIAEAADGLYGTGSA
jgi:hypothetical protein